MLFKAWYVGKKVYIGNNWDDFKALPESGVIWITVFYPQGRVFYNGGDWYYLQDNKLKYIPSGAWGSWQPRPEVECLSCVKQGVGVSDAEFEIVKELAWKDRGT